MAMVQKYKVQNKYYNICEITGNKDKVHQGLRIFYCKDFKTEWWTNNNGNNIKNTLCLTTIKAGWWLFTRTFRKPLFMHV